MALTKEQKQKIIEDLKKKIALQKAMVFIDFAGLKVKDLSALRKKLKTADGEMKIAKKTLINLVLKERKIEVNFKKMEGEIALVFSYKDEITPAKTVFQFSLENPNLKILGGFLENKLRGADEMIALAQLPTREELLANLVGRVKAPISNFIYALNYNIKGLMYLLSIIKKEQ